MSIDRQQPQAIELEETILGSLMMDSEAFDITIDFLKEEVFYKAAHQIIYRSISELHQTNSPIDIRTVANKLKGSGGLDLVGGPKTIANLTAGIGTTSNVLFHSVILYEKFLRRELIRIGIEMSEAAYDEDLDIKDSIYKHQDILEKLTQINANDFSPKKRLADAKEAVYKAMSSETGLSGVSTGYDSVDKFTGGLQPGDLIVVGGFPGTFKSALTLAIEHNAEKSGVPTFMFEQEMSGRQVGMREIAMATGIPTENLKIGKLTNDQVQEMEGAIGRLEKKKVFMDLSSGVKIGRIKSVLRKMVKEHGVGLCVIDYLGLCDLEEKKHGGKEQAIDAFCRELKVLAKTLDIPIILLAQFTKESASEKLKVPHTGLLKGSGAIEAHSDMTWLLWNPTAIDPNFQYDFMDGSGPFSTMGKLGLMHAKNRQGRIGLQFIGVSPETNLFYDL